MPPDKGGFAIKGAIKDVYNVVKNNTCTKKSQLRISLNFQFMILAFESLQ